MQLVRDPLPAEQHHPEEGRLEEERGQHFVAQQRPEDVAGLLAQHRPVGAELEAHDDARDHAHAERHGEDLQPEEIQVAPQRVARAQPAPFEERQPAGQADGEGGEQDVERDDEAELDPRQQQWHPRSALRRRAGCAAPHIVRRAACRTRSHATHDRIGRSRRNARAADMLTPLRAACCSTAGFHTHPCADRCRCPRPAPCCCRRRRRRNRADPADAGPGHGRPRLDRAAGRTGLVVLGRPARVLPRSSARARRSATPARKPIAGGIAHAASTAPRAPSSTRRSPVFDAQRTRMAFVRNGDVFVRDLRSGALTQVTRSDDDEVAAAMEQRRRPASGASATTGSSWTRARTASARPRWSRRKRIPAARAEGRRPARPAAAPDRHAEERPRASATPRARRTRHWRTADPTRAPAPVYLGDDVEIVDSALSPDGRWLLVVTTAKGADAGQAGKMPKYVTESGYEEFEDVRTRVGRNAPLPQTLWLVDVAAAQGQRTEVRRPARHRATIRWPRCARPRSRIR